MIQPAAGLGGGPAASLWRAIVERALDQGAGAIQIARQAKDEPERGERACEVGMIRRQSLLAQRQGVLEESLRTLEVTCGALENSQLVERLGPGEVAGGAAAGAQCK